MDPSSLRDWNLLQLDPATATPASVKRAYAKLIKLHRPESDPEGFSRVREAYQRALAELESKTGAAGASESAAVNFVESQPQPKDPWETRLAEAVNQSNATVVAKWLEEFRTQMKSDPSRQKSWGQMLHRQFAGKVDLLAEHLPPAGVVRLLDAGQPELVQQIARSWQSHNAAERLMKLAGSLIKQPQLLTEMPAAICASQIALLVSFPSPALGETLANLAYSQLTPGPARESIMDQVNVRLGWGRIFSKLPEENVRFWEERLTLDGDPSIYAWDMPEAKRQLMAVVSIARSDWPGYAILHAILPPLVWRSIEGLVQRSPMIGKLGASADKLLDSAPPASPKPLATDDEVTTKPPRRRRSKQPEARHQTRQRNDLNRVWKIICVVFVIVVVILYGVQRFLQAATMRNF